MTSRPLDSFLPDNDHESGRSLDYDDEVARYMQTAPELDFCPPKSWSPALRKYPGLLNQSTSSTRASSSNNQMTPWSYGETSSTWRRALPSLIPVRLFPSSSGSLPSRQQTSVAQLRTLAWPIADWSHPSIPGVLPPWPQPAMPLMRTNFGNETSWLRSGHNTNNRASSLYSIINNNAVSGIHLTPRNGTRYSFGEVLHNRIKGISDNRSAETGTRVHVVVHFDGGSSFLMPGTRITRQHRKRNGNNIVYVANKKTALDELLNQEHPIGRVFIFVNPSFDDVTTAYLKKLATAVNSRLIHQVMLVSSMPSSTNDLTRIQDIFGLIDFKYHMMRY